MVNTNKYETAKIYKLVDIGYTKCYIGSTIEPLSRRMTHHRSSYKNYKAGKYHYCSSFILFDEYGIDCIKIELIEEYPCNNKEQLVKREGEYIRQEQCVNKVIPGRSTKEWLVDNAEHVSKRQQQYRIDHQEELKQYEKRRRAHNLERIKEYDRLRDADRAEYKREKARAWYASHVDAVKQKEKCTICNGEFICRGRPRHERTQKHLTALNTQSQEV